MEGPNLIKVWAMPRVTMNFKNAPLEEVITTIARLSSQSVIISPDVSKAKSTVTTHFESVPWLQALESVVKTTGFMVVKESQKIIRIVTQDQLRSQMETRVRIRPAQGHCQQAEMACRPDPMHTRSPNRRAGASARSALYRPTGWL